MKRNFLFLSLFISLMWMIGCGGSKTGQDTAAAETETVSPDAETSPPPAVENAGCTSDADCVPATCCHASACIPTAEAPSCDDAMCTTECKDGTMDCGKGACACVDGACSVKWNN